MVREVKPLSIAEFKAANGKIPFREWLESLQIIDRATIDARIERLKQGNFGNYRSLGDGVSELKIDTGPGYRIYYGRQGNMLVILLCGGTKRTQKADIKTAKKYWKEFKEAKHE